MAKNEIPHISADALTGHALHIPDFRPAFASWTQGVNPHHEKVRVAVDERLEVIIENEKVLTKVKAADIALFASGLFPTASVEDLKTVAFYCVWLFLWDDTIDGGGDVVAIKDTSSGDESMDATADTGDGSATAAEVYCRRSVAFVRRALRIDVGVEESGSHAPWPEAPTRVCESFREVGARILADVDGDNNGGDDGDDGDDDDLKRGVVGSGERERGVLFGHLKEYMEGCVTEYKWRLSGQMPSVEQFYSWRLKTSSVDAMLDLCRIIKKIVLPREILDSDEHAAMSLSVNKLLILINELFSLKKELKDGAFGNLVPITMHALSLDLNGATRSLVQDIHDSIRIFDENASSIRTKIKPEQGPKVAEQWRQLTESYQTIATTVLNFSAQSPRYGLSKYRQEDGSYLVTL
ncbi:hypothetical protein VTI28DRAFT_9408 [Corynascus sepedonium]